MRSKTVMLVASVLSLVGFPLTVARALAEPAARTVLKTDLSASARKYVREFYDWYLPPVSKRKDTEPDSANALKNKRFAFSPELASALKADEEAAAKSPGEIVGLDFDPFLNAQYLYDSVEIGSVVVKGDVYQVPVYAINQGKKSDKPDVTPEVKQIGGRWTFTNFVYPPSNIPVNGNLLSILKVLKADRINSKKSGATVVR